MHRFFVPFETSADQPLTLRGAIAHQIARVLRLRAGERIGLFDGSGRERVMRIASVTPENVTGEIEAERQPVVEAALQLTLVQALLKGDTMDRVLQKGTEAGTVSFVPVVTSRSIPRGADDAKLGRWQRIVQEAAEQSGRVVVPSVASVATLDSAIAALKDTPILALWEEERQVGLASALRDLRQPLEKLALVIGPEGGLAESEVALVRAAGGRTASLGPRILRADTAGLIATAMVLVATGDLGNPDLPWG